jgi:Neocarzinostatin family
VRAASRHCRTGLVPAAAQVAPSVVVSPSTDLVDGQIVSVEASGFPTNTSLGVVECQAGATTSRDCDLETVAVRFSDASGHLTTDYATSRVIFTESLGRLDCATDACVLVVATADEAVVAAAPISFENTPLPPSPVEIQLEHPHYQEPPDIGGTTLRARISCATTADVTVRFSLRQTNPLGGTTTGSSTITVPCASGSEVLLFSDLLFGFKAGAAEVAVFAGIPQTVDAVAGSITIQPHAVVLAALQDRIASDPDALAELFAVIEWRLTYNPGVPHKVLPSDPARRVTGAGRLRRAVGRIWRARPAPLWCNLAGQSAGSSQRLAPTRNVATT